ncbi:MAG: hypothetical protein HF978_20935 [Desulfobacteraceae bacterium]|nr:hypothetical protein [Desulfobacteraceae bacterium]MBC2758015.1 hypothetical protein [Desulfobacteraceae bacterium]
MNWSLSLIAGLAASLSLFLSKPEKRILAWITVCLVLIPSGWQAHDTYQREKTESELRKHLTIKISRQTRGFLVLVRDMIYFSSDGWLPKTEDEFFSFTSADLICNHLNLDKIAPVLPERTWRRWIPKKTAEYKESLNKLLTDYSKIMGADLIEKIATAERSSFLGVYTRYLIVLEPIDKKLGVKRPPLFLPGGEKSFEKELKIIQSMYHAVRDLEKNSDFKNNWDFLRMDTSNRWPKKLLGNDRFDFNKTP